MKLLKERIPKLIDFGTVAGENGSIYFSEIGKDLPFAVKRVYYIVDVPVGSKRASHAHKKLDQVLVAIAGSFVVDITDGVKTWSFIMDDPGKAVLVPGGTWRTLHNFSKKAICLALASDVYDADDYIRDYDEFRRWKSE